MTRVSVTLAEAPTDVLVWLCGQSPSASLSGAVIARDAAPQDADAPVESTARALMLLLDLGYVEAERIDGTVLFRATRSGRAAVAAAQADADGSPWNDAMSDYPTPEEAS